MSSDDDKDAKPFPFKINVGKETRHVLDLAELAYHIGEELDILAKKARDLLEYNEHGEVDPDGVNGEARSLDEAYEKLEKLVIKLHENKASLSLSVSLS